MKNYLHLGLSALANTGSDPQRPWFVGHAGAAVLAGHFLLQDNALSAEVRSAIATHLERIVAAEPALFALQDTCASATPDSALIAALERAVQTHSAVGHGVIFGTLALRAIKEAPELQSDDVLTGLLDLIDDCLEEPADRHYGIEDYRSDKVDYSEMRRYTSVQDAAEHALTVHERIYPDQTLDGTFYFLAGNLLHCATWAHALLELEQIGYAEIATAGLETLARHTFLCARSHPNLEPLNNSEYHDPREAQFWSRPLLEPHQIKLAYSALALTRDYPEAAREEVFRALSTYWSFFP